MWGVMPGTELEDSGSAIVNMMSEVSIPNLGCSFSCVNFYIKLFIALAIKYLCE